MFSLGHRMCQFALLVATVLTSASCQKGGPSLSVAEAQQQQAETAEKLGIPVRFANSVGMEFVLIPAGSFTMGSPRGEPGRLETEVVRPVTLTKSFYMGTTEVTQQAWLALMEDNPSFVEGDQHPVETLSWEMAVAFCQKLSERDGRAYRLPTEAEWEYACRAGTTTPYHTGKDITTDQANYNGTTQGGIFRDETSPVGILGRNAWGLSDMHGNVWEWCSDWHADYSTAAVVDPTGPATGTTRIVRGGCWVNVPTVCRSASRGDADPVSWNFHFGFRVACDVTP